MDRLLQVSEMIQEFFESVTEFKSDFFQSTANMFFDSSVI